MGQPENLIRTIKPFGVIPNGFAVLLCCNFAAWRSSLFGMQWFSGCLDAFRQPEMVIAPLAVNQAFGDVWMISHVVPFWFSGCLCYSVKAA